MATVGHGMGRGEAGGGRVRRDVFPALGRLVGIGVVVGSAAVLAAAQMGVRDWQSLHNQITLGAAVGAILGLFIGLGRAVWRPGAVVPTQPPVNELPLQLWDPWLDSGREEEWTEPEERAEEPAIVVRRVDEPPIVRARVRPRVISPGTREAVRLEDEIGQLIQKGERGLVQIVGGPGSGKSTALRHLAAILPLWMQEQIQLLDDSESAAEDAHERLVISTALRVSHSKPFAVYPLARWGQDDLIEYLLAAHRERCPSVMARLKRTGNYTFLQGIPELWTIVLDLMAADESIGDVRSALRHELGARLGNHRLREQVEELCLTAFRKISNVGEHITPDLSVDEQADLQYGAEVFRLIRHAPVMVLLAADRLVHLAERGQDRPLFSQQLPRQLIYETAQLLSGNIQALQHLGEWIGQSRFRAIHPMVASLLRAVMPEWRPEALSHPRLAGAYLDGVKWAGINLEKVDLRSTDLAGADLLGAWLERAEARRACFGRADLRGAQLTGLWAERADFSQANLLCATAKHANFWYANLTDAVLIEANLSNADFRFANIDRADFSGANLEGACLPGLELRLARFEGVRFGGADLRFCNLEEMQLRAPDFHDANLLDALLTGSRLPGANFVGADLRNAKLAEVDWPGANLCGADLRGANFHLGSSRNGLVGSPIACEGSRTGFYTDDYHDQNVKPPEEIRKANLRGADLRGAKIQDVDFYLVDLRDAKYTSDQAEHFRSCHAIL